MNKYKLVALFGKSGAGKDTIQNWMVSNLQDTHKLISYTTRPPRDNEVDNQDYHFISVEEFNYMKEKNLFLETTEFRGWYYGTSIESLNENKINIGVFNPSGVKNILDNFQNQILVFPIEIWAPNKSRLIRSLTRENNPDCLEICRRFLADEEDFSNINFYSIKYPNYDDDNAYTKSFSSELLKSYFNGLAEIN